MAAHFLRHFLRMCIGGLTKLLTSAFILYHLLVYLPGGVLYEEHLYDNYSNSTPVASVASSRPSMSYYKVFVGGAVTVRSDPMSFSFYTGEPWPKRFVDWLLQVGTVDPNYADVAREMGFRAPAGVYLHVLDASLFADGALADNFGYSRWYSGTWTITDALQPGYEWIITFLSIVTLGLMLFVVWRRWGRPPAYLYHRQPSPRTADLTTMQSTNYIGGFWVA